MIPRLSHAFLLLALLPACSEASPMLLVTLDDGGVQPDGAPFGDATVSDAGSGSDAPELGDAPGTDVRVAPGTDAPVEPLDAGRSDDGGPASGTDTPMVSSLCYNSFIDPGEACDPGEIPDGGSPASIPGYPRCPDCSMHVCGGALDTVTNVCVGASALPGTCGGGLLHWSDVAERNRFFSLLRAEMVDAGLTTMQGMLSLRRYGGITGAWYWVDDLSTGSNMRLATALPPWGDRFPMAGQDYARLVLTATTAELFQTVGIGSGFCRTEPPGTPR